MERGAERFNQTGVPDQLKALRQWVVWKYGGRQGQEGKMKKVPYTPGANAKAKVDDPGTWRSFDEAVAGCETNGTHYDGIGYVFSQSDAFAGVDLDGCVGADGTITEEAKAILARLNSYSEYSPSGKGVKIWVEGRLLDGKIAHTARGTDFERIEVYDRARYFTVTGRRVDGTPVTIEERKDQLMAVYREYIGEPRRPPQTDLVGSAAAPSPGVAPATPANDVPTDDALIAKLRSDPEVSDRFSLLFDHGDLSSHDGDDTGCSSGMNASSTSRSGMFVSVRRSAPSSCPWCGVAVAPSWVSARAGPEGRSLQGTTTVARCRGDPGAWPVEYKVVPEPCRWSP